MPKSFAPIRKILSLLLLFGLLTSNFGYANPFITITSSIARSIPLIIQKTVEVVGTLGLATIFSTFDKEKEKRRYQKETGQQNHKGHQNAITPQKYHATLVRCEDGTLIPLLAPIPKDMPIETGIEPKYVCGTGQIQIVQNSPICKSIPELKKIETSIYVAPEKNVEPKIKECNYGKSQKLKPISDAKPQESSHNKEAQDPQASNDSKESPDEKDNPATQAEPKSEKQEVQTQSDTQEIETEESEDQPPDNQEIALDKDVDLDAEIEKILTNAAERAEDIRKLGRAAVSQLDDNIKNYKKFAEIIFAGYERNAQAIENEAIEKLLKIKDQKASLIIKNKPEHLAALPAYSNNDIVICEREFQDSRVFEEAAMKSRLRSKQRALNRGTPNLGQTNKKLKIIKTDTRIEIRNEQNEIVELYKKLKTGEWCRYLFPEGTTLEILELAEKWAELMYEKIRNRDDVAQIARNTGLLEHWIKRIKQHIFFDQHILDKGIGKLDPDPEIAATWERLFQGDFIINDISLLEHEYFESKLEKWYKLDNRTAHKCAQNDTGKPWYKPQYLEN